jgi:hypothetical protein
MTAVGCVKDCILWARFKRPLTKLTVIATIGKSLASKAAVKTITPVLDWMEEI